MGVQIGHKKDEKKITMEEILSDVDANTQIERLTAKVASLEWKLKESYATLAEVRKAKDDGSNELEALRAYANYFDCLEGRVSKGQALQVIGWHENGSLEPLDTFIQGAQKQYDDVRTDPNDLYRRNS